jgi:hypothetical protein
MRWVYHLAISFVLRLIREEKDEEQNHMVDSELSNGTSLGTDVLWYKYNSNNQANDYITNHLGNHQTDINSNDNTNNHNFNN